MGGSWRTSAALGANLLAEGVDRHQPAWALDIPEGPAIPCRRTLQLRRDRVDRALMLGGDQAAIRLDPCAITPGLVAQDVARLDHPALDEAAKRHARRLAL